MEDRTMEKEKVIDGITFSVVPFKALEALRLKSFLLKKFGPSLGQALGSMGNGIPTDGSLLDIKIDGAALSLAIEKLMEQLEEAQFIDLIKRMFRNVTASLVKEGKELQFNFIDATFETAMDVVFSGRLFSIYPVMLLVLEANFPDFFSSLAPEIAGIGRKIMTTVSSGQAGQNSTEESEVSGA
jgi:hypothetical protein